VIITREYLLLVYMWFTCRYINYYTLAVEKDRDQGRRNDVKARGADFRERALFLKETLFLRQYGTHGHAGFTYS
jgi:hypothetical protein